MQIYDKVTYYSLPETTGVVIDRENKIRVDFFLDVKIRLW